MIQGQENQEVKKRDKKNFFLSIGGMQFDDKNMNKYWGINYPLGAGYQRYFADNFRLEGSFRYIFNRMDYHQDNKIVGYVRLDWLQSDILFHLMIPQKDFEFFLGGGLHSSDVWQKVKFSGEKEEQDKQSGIGIKIAAGVELPLKKVDSFLQVDYSAARSAEGANLGGKTFTAGIRF